MSQVHIVRVINQRVNGNTTVALKDFGDGAEDLLANDHVLAIPVLGSLGHLQDVAAALAILVLAHVFFCFRECVAVFGLVV